MRTPIKVGLGAGAVMISFVTVAATSAVQPVTDAPVPASAFHDVAMPGGGPAAASDALSELPARTHAGGGLRPDGSAFADTRVGPASTSPAPRLSEPVPPGGGTAARMGTPAPPAGASTPATTATGTPPAVGTAPPIEWRWDPDVSWYGPGLYGHRTACGLELTEALVGVAHRSLPCGTLVVFSFGGRTVSAPVVDRGPYVQGRQWDLTAGLALRLGHLFTGPLHWRLA